VALSGVEIEAKKEIRGGRMKVGDLSGELSVDLRITDFISSGGAALVSSRDLSSADLLVNFKRSPKNLIHE